MERIFSLISRKPINWYPPHMKNGLAQVEGLFQDTSLVIEVRDARLPFQSKNSVLDEYFQSSTTIRNRFHEPIKRCVIFNKTELACPIVSRRLESLYRDEALLKEINVEKVFFVNARFKNSMFPVLDYIAETLVPKTGILLPKKKVIVVGVPNVGKSTVINKIRTASIGKKVKAVRTGALPGITKATGQLVRIMDYPMPIYLLDTPGILVPKIRNIEMALNLSLIESVKDGVIERELLVDYLYHVLLHHKEHSELYKAGLLAAIKGTAAELPETSSEYCHLLCIKEGMICNNNLPDLHGCRYKLLCMFRNGNFGPITLDPDCQTPLESWDTTWLRNREFNAYLENENVLKTVERVSNLKRFDRDVKKKIRIHEKAQVKKYGFIK